jgi:hypothetical protein
VITFPTPEGIGWIVDIADYERLGLTDTSSRWYATEAEAREFAYNLAAILIVPLESLADIEA